MVNFVVLKFIYFVFSPPPPHFLHYILLDLKKKNGFSWQFSYISLLTAGIKGKKYHA